MATISLTVPNPAVPRIAAAIGYSSTLSDGTPNPTTMATALKDWISNAIKDQVKRSEANTVSANAVNSNNTDVDNNLVIT